jgi:hypothetical protein
MRFCRGFGNWLLNQHVRAGVQEVACDFEVRGCLRDDADCVDGTQQLAVVSHGADSQLCADLVAGLLSRVGDGYELATRSLCVFLGVKSAEIADTDDCCSDFFHHKGIMPRLAAKESARCSL